MKRINFSFPRLLETSSRCLLQDNVEDAKLLRWTRLHQDEYMLGFILKCTLFIYLIHYLNSITRSYKTNLHRASIKNMTHKIDRIPLKVFFCYMKELLLNITNEPFYVKWEPLLTLPVKTDRNAFLIILQWLFS